MDPKLEAQLAQRLAKLSTDEIQDMLGPRRTEYTARACELAEHVLRERGIHDDTIQQLRDWLIERDNADAQWLAAEIARVEEIDQAGTDCHSCGADTPTNGFPFALAAVEYGERLFGLGSTVLSLITLPLVGIAYIHSETATRTRALVLTLRLCIDCQQEARWLGELYVAEKQCRLHPGFGPAENLGFTHYVSPAELAKSVRAS